MQSPAARLTFLLLLSATGFAPAAHANLFDYCKRGYEYLTDQRLRLAPVEAAKTLTSANDIPVLARYLKDHPELAKTAGAEALPWYAVRVNSPAALDLLLEAGIRPEGARARNELLELAAYSGKREGVLKVLEKHGLPTEVQAVPVKDLLASLADKPRVRAIRELSWEKLPPSDQAELIAYAPRVTNSYEMGALATLAGTSADARWIPILEKWAAELNDDRVHWHRIVGNQAKIALDALGTAPITATGPIEAAPAKGLRFNVRSPREPFYHLGKQEARAQIVDGKVVLRSFDGKTSHALNAEEISLLIAEGKLQKTEALEDVYGEFALRLAPAVALHMTADGPAARHYVQEAWRTARAKGWPLNSVEDLRKALFAYPIPSERALLELNTRAFPELRGSPKDRVAMFQKVSKDGPKKTLADVEEAFELERQRNTKLAEAQAKQRESMLPANRSSSGSSDTSSSSDSFQTLYNAATGGIDGNIATPW